MGFTNYEIQLSLEEIRKMSVDKYLKYIKTKAEENALKYLNKNQGSKSRQYEQLKMLEYLCPNDVIQPEMAKFIIKVQCQMIENVKLNFKNQFKANLICEICKLMLCSQPHLLECKILYSQIWGYFWKW